MATDDAPPDSAAGPDADIAPPAPAPVLSPLAVLGIVALVGSGACTVALVLQPAAERGWILPLITATSGLIGAWLLAWGRRARLVLPMAVLLCGLAALCFSLTWTLAGWPLAGVGLGTLGAWSYQRRARALVATVTLLAAGYAVAAAAGLLGSMRGHGHWWIAGQGFGSMLLGGLLLRFGTADEDGPGAGSDAPRPSGRTRARLRIAGRLLIVAGILLPYAALVMLELADVMVG